MGGTGVAAQKKRRYRSAASHRQARTRRVSWLHWRSQQYMALPHDKLWLLFRFAHLVTHATGGFGTFLSATCSQRFSLQGRQRDMFPLSQLEALECKPSNWSVQRWGLMSQSHQRRHRGFELVLWHKSWQPWARSSDSCAGGCCAPHHQQSAGL